MPKVLITNGKRPCTWYSGREGKVYPISGFSDTHFHTLVFGLGTIQKEDGELLYTEVEYNEVKRQRDKAIKDMAKHAEDLVRLRRELGELQGIHKAVELPREVAEAIQSFRDDGSDIDGIIRFLVDNFAGERLAIMRKYAAQHGFKFISALVNGYTVEHSPEEQQQEMVFQALKRWDALPSYGASTREDELQHLAKLIVKQLQT